jgi:hypothetical protein
MAAPTINVNLTLIDDADTNTTNWDKFGAGGQVGADEDIYIQDSNPGTAEQKAVVTTVGTAEVGLQYNGGDSTSLWGAQDHLFVWANYTAPAKLETTASGGQRICFGNQGGSVDSFFVGGSEAEYIAGGWRCLVASPNQAVQNGTIGTPYTSFGAAGLGAEGVGKDNFLVDVIRYGKGLQIVDGDTTNPGTMKSFTDVNDDISNQYGVVRASGAGAQVQGEVSIGHTDATSTDTYFSDSNYAIFVPNKNPLSGISTYATLDTFTGIRVLGSGTTAIFSNFGFSTDDDYDKGYFSCQPSYPFSYASGVVPASVELDGCTFQNWGQTQMSGLTTATNTTWISCEKITLNSGTLDNCTVEAGIGGTYVIAGSTPNNISNTSFIGVNTNNPSATGYGHAIEITSSGSYDFVNNSFVGFDTTGSDGAAIHIDGSGLNVTLNISGNDATASPTYKLSNGANTPVFNAAVTVNVTGLPVVPAPQDATEIRVLLAGQNLFATSVGIGTTDVSAGVGTETHRTGTFSFNITKDIDIDLRIINLDYEPQFISSIRTANDPTNISANLKEDRVSQNLKQ